MKIIKYKKIGLNRYKIFLDDTSIILYEDIILKYNLLLKEEIDIKTIDDVLNENRYYDAYYLALNYFEIKIRNKKEIREYLKRKDFEYEYIDFAINKLNDLSLLNDKKYIECYVNDKVNLSNDGPFKIKRNLIEFELNESDIDEYLNTIDMSVWKNKLKKIINKKLSLMKNKSYYVIINKLKNDLFNLGYDKNMIDELLEDIEYDNSNIKKEYEKISKKYTDKNKIMNYLLRKGYTYEEIKNIQ